MGITDFTLPTLWRWVRSDEGIAGGSYRSRTTESSIMILPVTISLMPDHFRGGLAAARALGAGAGGEARGLGVHPVVAVRGVRVIQAGLRHEHGLGDVPGQDGLGGQGAAARENVFAVLGKGHDRRGAGVHRAEGLQLLRHGDRVDAGLGAELL